MFLRTQPKLQQLLTAVLHADNKGHLVQHTDSHHVYFAAATTWVSVQEAAHQQELQRLHRQYAAMMHDLLGKMRDKLQEQYADACGDPVL